MVMMTSENPVHLCFQNDKINRIQEDLNTVKMELGYKNQSNGEFRKKVEDNDRTLSDSVQEIHDSVIRIETKQASQDRIIAILFTVFMGCLSLIYIL